jgi:hypothetical protein
MGAPLEARQTQPVEVAPGERHRQRWAAQAPWLVGGLARIPGQGLVSQHLILWHGLQMLTKPFREGFAA